MRFAMVAALAWLVGLAAPAFAADKVRFGTNWLADPAAGGFYQAVADGTYAKYGLDVTIVPGGPQANGGLLLLFGKLDFFMGGDMIGNLLSAESKLPLIAVAADFQKSPQMLMSHPGVGLDTWKDLPSAKPVYLGAGAINTFYAWLRLAYGFKDEYVRPYNFNSAPFIANKMSLQQGYATAEPFEIARQGGFKPNVFLLADHGYSTYATLIVTRAEIVEKQPDLVQRFVDASAIGWYHYLYGDSSKGERADQDGQSRHHRRADRLLHRQAEGGRHRRFRRRAEARHRRHDRRALEGLFRQDGRDRHGRSEDRLQEGLHARVRQQGRRPRPQAEVTRRLTDRCPGP